MRTDLSFDTKAKTEIVDITDQLKKLVTDSGILNGTLMLYSLHTTMGLFVNEADEPNLCQDILNQLDKIVDGNGESYLHTCARHPVCTPNNDKANGPSHVRQSLINQHVILDVKDGGLVLGKWQRVAFVELDGPRVDRRIHVKLISDTN